VTRPASDEETNGYRLCLVDGRVRRQHRLGRTAREAPRVRGCVRLGVGGEVGRACVGVCERIEREARSVCERIEREARSVRERIGREIG
jgi:hypothetical protein